MSRSVLALIGCLLASSAAFGGPLDPPAGPPTSTMKRLDAIEPRVCINDLAGDEGAVHIISQPGTYYLTGDVSVGQGQSGIRVTTPGDVRVDLNGFTVRGQQGSGFGVSVDVSGDGEVIVVGGSVEGCGGGVFVSGREGVRIERMRVSNCPGQGVCVDYNDNDFDLRCEEVHVARCSDGVCVQAGNNYGTGGGGGGGRVVVRSSSCVSCPGDGLRCEGPPDPGNGTVNAWTLEVRVNRWECRSVGGSGIECAVCHLICNDSSVTDCGSAGLRVRGNGAEQGVDCGGFLVARCGGAGTDPNEGGIVCESLSSVSLARCRVSSCIGDGMYCGDTDHFIVDSSDIDGCTGNGCTAKNVVRFKAGSELSGKVNIANCGGNGVGTEGCPEVDMCSVEVSSCVGDGVSHTYPAGSSLTRCSIVHRDVATRGCANGASLSVLSSGFVRCGFDQADCVSTGNAGHGCAVACPIRCVVDASCSSCVISDNAGDGLRVSADPDSSDVRIYISRCRCSDNGGSGAVCVSSTPGASMIAGGSMTISESSMCGNSVSGVYSEKACYCSSSLMCDNGVSGLHVVCPSSTTVAGRVSDCDLDRSGGPGLRCERGKFSCVSSRMCDNGAEGVRCDDGCLVMMRCDVNANATDGVSVSGTLNLQDSTCRRNGGVGVRCADGSCRASSSVCELNGAAGPGGGGAIFVDCRSVSLERCEFSDNIGDGVVCSTSSGLVRWMAPECLASGNLGNGFTLNNCVGELSRCVATGNVGLGIHVQALCSSMRIADNSCPGNAGGLQVDGSGCLVVGNTATADATGGITVAPGNAGGPVVDAAAIGQGGCDPCTNIVY